MSSIGEDFSESDHSSSPRLNRRGYSRINGDDINAYALVGDTKLFYALTDDGGLKKNNLYATSADDLQRLNMTQNVHRHTSEADTDGGGLLPILGGNMGVYELNLETPTTYDFYVESTDAASVPQDTLANAQTYINMRTTTATNSFSNILKGGIRLGFTDNIWLVMKLQISHNAAILWRAGVNMVRANQTDSGVVKEFGIESCSAQTDPTKVMIVTSNGAGVRTAAASNSLVVPVTNSLRGFKLSFSPADKVVYQDSDGNTNTITTNIPSSSATDGDGVFRASVKTQTTAIRNLFLAGVKLKGAINDSTGWIA
jgi:hypothetical protein